MTTKIIHAIRKDNVEFRVRTRYATAKQIEDEYNSLFSTDPTTIASFEDEQAAIAEFNRIKDSHVRTTFFRSSAGLYASADVIWLESIEVDEDGEFVEMIDMYDFACEAIAEEDDDDEEEED